MRTNESNQISDYAATTIRIKARQLVGRAGFLRDDLEDIEQELRTDLLERLPAYDAEKAGCNTFAAQTIGHKIFHMIRERKAACRDWRRVECSVNDIITEATGKKVQRASTMDKDEIDIRSGKRHRTMRSEDDLRLDVMHVMEILPEALREIAELLKDHSVSEVSHIMGISRTALYRQIAIIRQAFREAGLQEFVS